MSRYVAEIWKLRYFWFSLVRADLRRRYRGSVLGLGWSLLQPIAMTIVLCVVFSTLFKADVKTYAPFLLAGLVTWSFFVAAMAQGCQCFFQGESYIRQCPAPMAIYPLRTVLGAGFHFCVGLLVVAAMVLCFKGPQNPLPLVTLPLTFVLIFAFAWSLAVFVGVMNVMFQDTQHLTDVGVQILFYATPILYPAELLRARHLGWFLAVNPFSSFLELVRLPLLEGTFPPSEAILTACVSTSLAAAAASVLLWRVERKLIFYL